MADRVKGIYKITSPTGRVYIGQSINIHARFKRYRDLNCKSQRKLYRSFLKYGHKSHHFQIVHELPEDVSKDVMDGFEKLFIETYTYCRYKMLNIREGGGNGASSRETRIRQSIALKGREVKVVPISIIKGEFLTGTPINVLKDKYNISHSALLKRLKKEIGADKVKAINTERKLASLNQLAKKFNPGFTPWNKGMSTGTGTANNFYGKTHTQDTKSKMSVQKEKAVLCLNDNTEYRSTLDAAEKLGLHPSSIAKVARGYQKQHKGHIFKYL